MKKRGPASSEPCRLSWEETIPGEAMPEPTRESLRPTGSGLEQGELPTILELIRENEGAMARDAAEVIVQPVHRPAHESIAPLDRGRHCLDALVTHAGHYPAHRMPNSLLR